jgi:hypothetical protein
MIWYLLAVLLVGGSVVMHRVRSGRGTTGAGPRLNAPTGSPSVQSPRTHSRRGGGM